MTKVSFTLVTKRQELSLLASVNDKTIFEKTLFMAMKTHIPGLSVETA